MMVSQCNRRTLIHGISTAVSACLLLAGSLLASPAPSARAQDYTVLSANGFTLTFHRTTSIMLTSLSGEGSGNYTDGWTGQPIPEGGDETMGTGGSGPADYDSSSHTISCGCWLQITANKTSLGESMYGSGITGGDVNFTVNGPSNEDSSDYIVTVTIQPSGDSVVTGWDDSTSFPYCPSYASANGDAAPTWGLGLSGSGDGQTNSWSTSNSELVGSNTVYYDYQGSTGIGGDPDLNLVKDVAMTDNGDNTASGDFSWPIGVAITGHAQTSSTSNYYVCMVGASEALHPLNIEYAAP